MEVAKALGGSFKLFMLQQEMMKAVAVAMRTLIQVHKFVPCSSQIVTNSVPTLKYFYRLNALSAAKPTMTNNCKNKQLKHINTLACYQDDLVEISTEKNNS